MLESLLSNTLKYTRFILRRERINISVWIVLLVVITLAQAYSYVDLYPTEQERQIIAESMENPAMVVMMGQVYGKDNYTVGALLSNQSLLFTAIAVAIMSILIVNRNTKGDEEAGSTEVIRSLPMGRLSNTFAVLIVIMVVNVILSLVIGLGLYSLGIESLSLNGSLLFGAVLGAIGFVFAAITALFAQLTCSTRGTLGISFGVLGVFYFIRAIGDIYNEKLALLSPLGWIMRSEVYVNNNWQYVIITIGIAIVIMLVSLFLNSLRDMGGGLIAIKAGKQSASAFLSNPFGLGIRILRSSMFAWCIGMLILGLAYGSLLGDIEVQFESSETMKEIFSYGTGYSPVEQFVTVIMTLIAMLSTMPVLLSVLKLKGEEKVNRTENIVSKAVSKSKLMGSFLAIGILLSFITQLLFASGFWYAGSRVLDNQLTFRSILSSAMVYLPAVWLMVGLALLLIGCFPRGTILVWVYFGYSFLVVFLGPILQLPDEMKKFSQYENIPKIPIDDMDYTKITVITILAVLFITLGFMGYRKRDMQNI